MTETRLFNPVDQAIKKIFLQLKLLKFSSMAELIASTIAMVVLITVIAVLSILWIYGFVPAIATVLWGLIPTTLKQMRGLNRLEQAPFLIALGIYFLIWLPFFLLSSPLYLLGYAARYLSQEDHKNGINLADSSENLEQPALGPNLFFILFL